MTAQRVSVMPKKQAKIGRPRSANPKRGTHTVSVDVAPATMRRVDKLARKDGRSTRQWIGRLIDREVARQEAAEPTP